VGLESTVVALLAGPPRLLRPGAVTRLELEAVLGPIAEAESDARRSPGRMALHYAPDAPVRLEAAHLRPGEVGIGFGPGDPAHLNLSPTGDLREAAANLFTMLRAADRSRPTGIAISPVPRDGLGEAINDRLSRAAGLVG
jgi:L-threonylcarbamoyladenylate synthase